MAAVSLNCRCLWR